MNSLAFITFHCKVIAIHHNPLQTYCYTYSTVRSPLQTNCNLLQSIANSLQFIAIFSNSMQFIQNAHINSTLYKYILALRTSMEMSNHYNNTIATAHNVTHDNMTCMADMIFFLVDNGKLWSRMILALETSSHFVSNDETGAQITPPALFSAFVFSMAPVTASNH